MASRRTFFSVHLLDNFDAKPSCTLGQQLVGKQTSTDGTPINLVGGIIQVSSLEEMYGGLKHLFQQILNLCGAPTWATKKRHSETAWYNIIIMPLVKW